jgi:uncharacterized protein YkwD
MRSRRLLIISSLVALLLTSAWAPAEADAHTHQRARVLRLVNDVRARHGLKRLDLNRKLSRYATRHSRRMSEQRRLFHSTDLGSRLRTYKASWWGENLAYGGKLYPIVRAWMNSPSHRVNILNRRFRKTGIGVVRVGGRFWVTQIFYG